MPTLSVGQKAERALKLLLGLGRAPIAQRMSRYGFTEADRQEGWQRLQALTSSRMWAPAPEKPDVRPIARLDAWENVWFPIAHASLRDRFPDVHEWLFFNLAQSSGPAVLVSVSAFVQRLARMAQEPALGARGAEARALLEKRGLDAQAIAMAGDLLEQLRTLQPPAEPERDIAAEAAAEAALWSWYREWSEIARVAITDRRLLRELGFLGSKRSAREDEDQEQAE
jgi:hypothetical protein